VQDYPSLLGPTRMVGRMTEPPSFDVIRVWRIKIDSIGLRKKQDDMTTISIQNNQPHKIQDYMHAAHNVYQFKQLLAELMSLPTIKGPNQLPGCDTSIHWITDRLGKYKVYRAIQTLRHKASTELKWRSHVHTHTHAHTRLDRSLNQARKDQL